MSVRRVASCAAVLFGFGCDSAPAKPASARPAAEKSASARPEPTASSTVTRPAPVLSDTRIDWDANRTMQVLGQVSATMNATEYNHGLRVDEREGVYEFDCSGMVEWVLRKASLRLAASGPDVGQRPLARDFQRRIAAAPIGAARSGWQRIARVKEAQPGDVIAWIKPAELDSPHTGHVAFIVLDPVPVAGNADAFLVRVADSSSLLHDDDTRVGRSGFGLGTILILTDEATGGPRAFGWVGLRSPRTFETPIAIGRAVR